MFENIIGNEKIKKILSQSVKIGKSSHSYLFIGTEGIGKKLIAKEFAKMLMCLDEQKYCGKCKSCIEFNTNNNPDFFFIEPEAKSIKIEQIREMQKKVSERPIISSKKIYIIDNADTMTIEAQNCLLKTLEEPPEYVTIILIGSNENNFLNTIKSRCTIIHFEDISDKELTKYLKENYSLENITQNMLNTFQGSIGKAIILKDKNELYEKIDNMIYNLEKVDLIETIDKAEIIYKSKDDIFEILDYINVVIAKLARQNLKYIGCVDIIEDTKKRLKANGYYDMCVDNMIFSLWEEINEKYSRS